MPTETYVRQLLRASQDAGGTVSSTLDGLVPDIGTSVDDVLQAVLMLAAKAPSRSNAKAARWPYANSRHTPASTSARRRRART